MIEVNNYFTFRSTYCFPWFTAWRPIEFGHLADSLLKRDFFVLIPSAYCEDFNMICKYLTVNIENFRRRWNWNIDLFFFFSNGVDVLVLRENLYVTVNLIFGFLFLLHKYPPKKS